jgi:uncharacterized protein YecE (DUF72 family)
MNALVGCSGWSYDDWVGRFYPYELRDERWRWFSFYSEYFPAVEVNSSFYKPPTEQVIAAWLEKVKDMGPFEFSMKLPQVVTHAHLVDGDVNKAVQAARAFEDVSLLPMTSAGRLGAALVQMSPYFRNEGGNLQMLKDFLDSLSLSAICYAVEFRHRSWLNAAHNELEVNVLDALSDRNVANVFLDGPGFPVTTAATADHAYFRFHGRNRDIWFSGEKEDDGRIDRYDYLYSESQLKPWATKVKLISSDVNMVRVFFNNHGRSKAVRNAFNMMDMLGIPHKERQFQIQDQATLSDFMSP